jgi:hypothetical protein
MRKYGLLLFVHSMAKRLDSGPDISRFEITVARVDTRLIGKPDYSFCDRWANISSLRIIAITALFSFLPSYKSQH